MSAAGNTCACGGGRALAALPACLHGVFRVERRIGRGGMGIVYLGSDLRLDRPVALKTLPCLSSASVTTLRNEARAMAAVTHPSVAVLFGLEEWRGTPVLVTEYLPGGTLAARIAAGPLPLTDALALGATVADALAVLHGRGWLHRDIKPSNIGFCSEGTPKLLDFGLTRWRPATDDSSEPLAGTPLYLSPELLDGETPSAHDDIWALALVVVEMITGAHPFRADRLEDALSQVRSRTPVNVRHRVPTVPSSVDHVLSRALHPIPSRRFTSARELAAALRAVRIPS
jgi:serine/threonine-protein kinase